MPNFSQPAADRRCNSLCRGLGKSVFMNPFLPSPWETIVAAVVPGDRVLGNGEDPGRATSRWGFLYLSAFDSAGNVVRQAAERVRGEGEPRGQGR